MSDDQIGILNYYLDMERNSSRVILETAITIRKLLNNVSETRLTRIIDSGVPIMLVKFLDDDEIAKHFHIVSSGQEQKNTTLKSITIEYLYELRYEVICSLTNISIAHTDYVVSLNCLGNIKKIFENRDTAIVLVEECMWTLANISADSIKSRDLVLNEDVLPILLRLLNEMEDLSFLRIATWCLSNMLRGTPYVPFECVEMALPTLIDLTRSFNDVEILTDVCHAISYAIDRPVYDHRAVEYFINAGATDTIISFINEMEIQKPALRIIGNLIVSGTDSNTDRVLEAGILDAISKLLSTDPEISIRKECVWILSNIAAGNENHKRKLIDTGLIQETIEMINDPNTSYTIKKEAYWTIRNIGDCSDEDILKYLFDCDVVKLFKIGLDGESSSFCLDGLNVLLKQSKERTMQVMNKYEIVDIIKSMIPELNTDDAEVAQSILSHFDSPEE